MPPPTFLSEPKVAGRSSVEEAAAPFSVLADGVLEGLTYRSVLPAERCFLNRVLLLGLSFNLTGTLPSPLVSFDNRLRNRASRL